MKHWMMALSGALLIASANAVTLDQVAYDKSRIGFVSKQMGVPVEGGFRKFDAQVSVDPAQPQNGKARVEVDLASIDTGSAEADAEVKGKGWFNVATFPKAVFVANQIKPLGGGRFEARGPLTIKGISRDIVAQFSMRNEGIGAWVDGGFVLPRLQFRIGEGEWSDPETVADAVQVKFKLFLTPKK